MNSEWQPRRSVSYLFDNVYLKIYSRVGKINGGWRWVCVGVSIRSGPGRVGEVGVLLGVDPDSGYTFMRIDRKLRGKFSKLSKMFF